MPEPKMGYSCTQNTRSIPSKNRRNSSEFLHLRRQGGINLAFVKPLISLILTSNNAADFRLFWYYGVQVGGPICTHLAQLVADKTQLLTVIRGSIKLGGAMSRSGMGVFVKYVLSFAAVLLLTGCQSPMTPEQAMMMHQTGLALINANSAPRTAVYAAPPQQVCGVSSFSTNRSYACR